ncbi:hypothetical protein [Amorphus orientalis]|uniref:Uncharacterized protein n=1 Tax=Amorphus orientalis TaxID=649198 RepID=A0AAE3VSQ1_9HYPH|nr:hypothetical protein [Amorphus orientalis]MDQ0317110.1 hypothetical protein [Amorphus orientalis]
MAEHESDPQLAVTADDAARYIESMSAELSRIAHRSGFDVLAYLLDVAREEAAARAVEVTARPPSRLS